MAADTPPGMEFDAGTNINLCLNGPDMDKLSGWYAALGEGGQVEMPLTPTFFADKFGMVADKFGVSWMILAAKK